MSNIIDVEHLKRWHWCVIGLAAGLLLASAKLWLAPHQLPRNMGQEDFERAILKPRVEGHPALIDVLVRPPQQNDQLVTGLQLVEIAPRKYLYMSFSFAAPVPYQGSSAMTPADSLWHVLAQAKKQNPSLQYHYAWWASPIMTFVLWASGMLIAIGVIWPTVLALLLDAGYGPKRVEPKYDLDRFASNPPVQLTIGTGCETDLSREENTQLEPASNDLDTAPAAPATVISLSNTALETISSTPVEEDKAFKGEFYPTIVHAPNPKSKTGE